MPPPSTSPRRRNRRGEGERLRAEIVQAASSLLEQSGGEDALTLRAVARAVGITAPSIYPHFADRESIKIAVVEQTFTVLAASLRPALDHPERPEDPVAALHAVARAYLDFASEHPRLYRVLFERHRAESIEPGSGAKDVTGILGADAYGVLLAAVRGCVVAGCSEDSTAEPATVRLWVSLHGLATLRASLPWFPWPPRDEVARELVDRAVGLRTQRSG